jgi:outer membrane protein OmpA-like peptidoglycan-associated protein
VRDGQVRGAEDTGFLSSAFTDLMISIAIVFILLSVVFIREASRRSRRDKEVIRTSLSELLKENQLPLKQEPSDPLVMSVSMGEDVLKFPLNSTAVSEAGNRFLDRFIPELLGQLCSPAIRSKVDAVLIEGHTDRSGEATADGVRRNIRLSQSRSFSVLERSLQSLKSNGSLSECFLSLASATGRGSRVPVEAGGQYSADLSRRVEIKIRVKSSEQNLKIWGAAGK